jgi:foldase protein PrsA
MLSSVGAAQHEALFRDFSVNARLLIPLAAVLSALAVLASGCGGSASASLPSGVVARCGGQDITRSELDTVLEQAKKGYELQKRQWPSAGSPEYKQVQDQAVNLLIQRCELAQKAHELGITVTDAQVGKRLEQIKKQSNWNTQQKYLNAIKERGYTDAQVHELIRDQLISEALYKKIVKGVKVTDKDLKDYYEQNIANYRQGESRDVRHILVQNKAKADQIYEQLRGGASFAALAKKYSKDPGTKDKGGKFTVVKDQGVAPEFEKTTFELKTGELAKPIKTQYGWHVIEAVGPIKPPRVTPFEDVKKQIKSTVTQTKSTQVVQQWQADLTKEYEKKLKYAKGFEPQPTQTTPAQTTPTPTGG